MASATEGESSHEVNDDEVENIYDRVQIRKENQSFGLKLQQYNNPDSENDPYECFIQTVKDSAEKSMEGGLLHPGDRVMSVNNIDVHGWTFDDVVEAVRETPEGEPLVLDVSRAISIDHGSVGNITSTTKSTSFSNGTTSYAGHADRAAPIKPDSEGSELRNRLDPSKERFETDEKPLIFSPEDKENLEPDQYKLEEDIFSLLFMSNPKSLAFLFSLVVFIFQMTVIILIMCDMFINAPEGNPLKIPPGVNGAVVAAQFLALIVSVLSQDDVVTALEMIHHGYNHENLRTYPHATFSKYIFATSARFIEGICTIVISFIFIVTSPTVLDIFKDFAAVAFVSHLDNIAFHLAIRGFTTRSIQREAKRVQDATFYKDDFVGQKLKIVRQRNVNQQFLLQNFIVALCLVSIFIPWVVVTTRQSQGYYKSPSCKSITVQFGDETLLLEGGRALHYAYFSNTYVAQQKDGRFVLEGDRPVYYERGREAPVHHNNGRVLAPAPTSSPSYEKYPTKGTKSQKGDSRKYSTVGTKSQKDDRPPGKFSYQKDLRVWVFTIEGVGRDTDANTACGNWLLRSPETDAYALEDVPLAGWMIWTGKIEVAKDFSLFCDECKCDVDCNYNGNCYNGACECDEGWSGKRCDSGAENHCDELVFINYGQTCVEYSEQPGYNLLRSENGTATHMYDRPIYFRLHSDLLSGNRVVVTGFNAVIYTGRRWLEVDWPMSKFSNASNIFSEETYHAHWNSVLENHFTKESYHAHWDSLLEKNILQFSEPTDSSTPIGLEWHRILSSRSGGDFGPFGKSRKTIASFHCNQVDCEKTSICGEHGSCNNSQCSCDNYTMGHFCEFHLFDYDDEYAQNDNCF